MLTIGVAIGGTGAVFSLVNAVLLQPLPYREPARLVTIWEDNAKAGFPATRWRQSTTRCWRPHNEVFASIAAVAGYSATLSGDGAPEKIEGRRVTQAFFDVLGVAPGTRTRVPSRRRIARCAAGWRF